MNGWSGWFQMVYNGVYGSCGIARNHGIIGWNFMEWDGLNRWKKGWMDDIL
jgi:hypothetical protein